MKVVNLNRIRRRFRITNGTKSENEYSDNEHGIQNITRTGVSITTYATTSTATVKSDTNQYMSMPGDNYSDLTEGNTALKSRQVDDACIVLQPLLKCSIMGKLDDQRQEDGTDGGTNVLDDNERLRCRVKELTNEVKHLKSMLEDKEEEKQMWRKSYLQVQEQLLY